MSASPGAAATQAAPAVLAAWELVVVALVAGLVAGASVVGAVLVVGVAFVALLKVVYCFADAIPRRKVV